MFKDTGGAPIENYDVKTKKAPLKHRNEFMPKDPGIFNAIMCAPTGSGKTNTLLNMIFEYLYYDKLYLYANNAEQDVYVNLKKHFDSAAELRDWDPSELYHFGSSLKEVVPVDEMDRNKVNLVIFDDFVLAKDQSIIEDYWVRGRHKNCISIYLSQTYSGIPITIRRNTRIYMIWNVSRGRDIGLIWSDVGQELPKKEFTDIFYQVVREPYNFLYVDRNAKPEKKYRKNFDGIMTNARYLR